MAGEQGDPVSLPFIPGGSSTHSPVGPRFIPRQDCTQRAVPTPPPPPPPPPAWPPQALLLPTLVLNPPTVHGYHAPSSGLPKERGEAGAVKGEAAPPAAAAARSPFFLPGKACGGLSPSVHASTVRPASSARPGALCQQPRQPHGQAHGRTDGCKDGCMRWHAAARTHAPQDLERVAKRHRHRQLGDGVGIELNARGGGLEKVGRPLAPRPSRARVCRSRAPVPFVLKFIGGMWVPRQGAMSARTRTRREKPKAHTSAQGSETWPYTTPAPP